MLVQFQDFYSKSGSLRFDCTSKHPEHPKCLFTQKEFKINVPHFPGGKRHERIIRSTDDVWEYIHYACDLVPEETEVGHLLRIAGIGVCPVPLFTDLSRELLKMYRLCGKDRWPYPGSYFDQLTAYVDGIAIIIAEDNRKMRLEDKNASK